MDQNSQAPLVRPKNVELKSRPSRAVAMAFVDLAAAGHERPQVDQDYGVVSASDPRLEKLPFPSSSQRVLDLDVYEFYSGDLPEGIFGGRNEGLLKVRAHTTDPQSTDEKDAVATWVTEFSVRDDQYAAGFLFRGIFRNILIRDFTNIAVDLYEMDGDAGNYYKKFKQVIDKVPEVKSLDVFKGIPYLNIATGLFEGVIEVFGKNADDHIWGDIPLLEIDPVIGGAFLRSGMYVIYERQRKNVVIDVDDLLIRNGRLRSKTGKKLGAHIVVGLRLREYTGRRG